jgi:beta-phosphoglucomutase
MILAIVFDFDGVIADSEPLHLRCYQQVLAPRGVELSADEYYADYVGFDDLEAFTRIGLAHGLPMNDGLLAQLIVEKTRVFEAVTASADVLFPGAIACIERLAAAFPLGIASGALKQDITGILRRHGLERYFAFIVASGDTPRSKPAPDPYMRAAQLHGLPPSACLAIEDSKWGIESARSAGLRCIGITNTYPSEELAAAEHIIESLDEFTPELVAALGVSSPRTPPV